MDIPQVISFLVLFTLLYVRHYALLFVIQPLREQLGQIGTINLAFVFSILFVPITLKNISSQIISGLSASQLFLAVISEAFLGMLVALPVCIFIMAIPMGLRLVDNARGAQTAEQNSPMIAERVSLLENAGLIFILAFLFKSKTHLVVSEYLLQMTKLLVANSNISIDLILGKFALIEFFASFVCSALKVALFFAFPLIFAVFLIDCASCFLGRLIPRVNIANELMPLKLFSALALLSVILKISAFDFSLLPVMIDRGLGQIVDIIKS